MSYNIEWIDDHIIIASKLISTEDMDKNAGEFYDESNYTYVVDSDMDIYNEDGELICLFRKKVIPKEISDLGRDTFLDIASKTKTNSRGFAAGKLDFDKLSKNIVEIVNPERCKSKVIFKDGRVSKYTVCNNVNSMIGGYYDKKLLSKKANLQQKGRETKFTENYKNKWDNFLPFFKYMDKLFKKFNPEQYKLQKEEVSDSKFSIDDTIFTTVTVNHNFRTAAHKDSGNLDGGYSAFTICESGDWDGCYLGYPQYGVCVDVREGDFLIMNPHIYHCNTEFKLNDENNYDRLSFVLYARKGLV